MLFQLLFLILFGLLGILVSFLPGFGDVPLLLPWGTDPIVVQAFSYMRGAVDTLPYLELPLQLFLYSIAFEIAMLFGKLFLGSRNPVK